MSKETEIAEVLGISLATLHRDWKFSRAWLISRLVLLSRKGTRIPTAS